jgi:hypothetical protein
MNCKCGKEIQSGIDYCSEECCKKDIKYNIDYVVNGIYIDEYLNKYCIEI